MKFEETEDYLAEELDLEASLSGLSPEGASVTASGSDAVSTAGSSTANDARRTPRTVNGISFIRTPNSRFAMRELSSAEAALNCANTVTTTSAKSVVESAASYSYPQDGHATS